MAKKNSWYSFMPAVFRWLEELQLEETLSVSEGALHIVPAEFTASNVPKLDLDKLPTDVATEVAAAVKAVGWHGENGLIITDICNCHFLLLPIPKLDSSRVQKARQVGLDAARHLADFRFSHLVICASQLDPLQVFDGLVLGVYSMKFKNTPAAEDDASQLPDKVQILGKVPANVIADSKALASSVVLARTLQDSPPNWLNAEKFAELAAEIADELQISCRVLGHKEISALSMGSFLCVAQGSTAAPRLIAMEVTGNDPSQRIALVGKGITFDSGGISLKPGKGMMDMKYDMSGAAAVLSTMYYLAKNKPAVNVVGLIGAAENMPSGQATRPGDIVTAMNNTSIEVLDTDAEGRLVLADVLCYAVQEYRPQLIIDIATLTGTVLHALGQNGGGLMSNNQKAAELVLKAATEAGEPFWQLPLWPELRKGVKGTYADLKNVADDSTKADSLAAAWFLERFVAGTPWVHLDIAGTAHDCAATGYPEKGSCAFGLRTMATVCQSIQNDSVSRY